MRFLLVDDDAVCRRTLQAFLKGCGTLVSACDGVEAVELFRQSLRDGPRFNVVCLDINMPNMDGQEAIQQIRKLEEEAGILLGDGARVIMTTALGDKDNVFTAFRSSADGYLTKPFHKQQLQDLFKKLGVAVGVEKEG